MEQSAGAYEEYWKYWPIWFQMDAFVVGTPDQFSMYQYLPVVKQISIKVPYVILHEYDVFLCCFICCIPASIATLAQRWPNVNPYVGPTSAHQRWANVDLSIGPTLAQRLHANVGPTLCQHWSNVGTLTLGQRWHNVMPMVVCQRCTNIGPTEAALLAFCEGNPSVTDRSPVEQTVELSNQWFETPMWSTSMSYSHV